MPMPYLGQLNQCLWRWDDQSINNLKNFSGESTVKPRLRISLIPSRKKAVADTNPQVFYDGFISIHFMIEAWNI